MEFQPMLKRIFHVGLLLFAVCPEGVAADGRCAAPQAAEDVKFRPGQVWAYRTRPGEEGSTITILRVETYGKVGTIVHVRLEGIHLHNCTGGPAPETIAHAPFARAALEASVTRQVGTVATLPAFEEGYQDWLRHCGGVYTIHVDRVVEIDDQTFQAGLGCH